MSHLPKRWFSGAAAAALALALLPAVAMAQDSNPLDRVDEPEPSAERPAPPTQPVHQPAPAAPSHHHHPPEQHPPPPHGAGQGAPLPSDRVVGYDEKSEPRTGLIVAGAVLFGVAYAIPLIGAAATNFRNESQWLAVPVVGPWMTIGEQRYGSCSNRRFVEEDCDDEDEQAADVLAAVGLGFVGVVQAAGAALLITGAATSKTKMVPIYAVVPMPLNGGAGVALTGSF